MTKGQMEAKISEVINKYEIEITGRGPKQTKAAIVQDLIIVRMKGSYLSELVLKLDKKEDGMELVKKMGLLMLENSEEKLKRELKELTGVEITSIHADMNNKTGEKIIVISASLDLENSISC